ncbi:hypothetical protein DL96DRAFT_201750 [Flagelloscypha sp. PMI_526]|nr:hypothetical protein DL96DRAFT_201750 [Flagelloscypha sp. PMI_526]
MERGLSPKFCLFIPVRLFTAFAEEMYLVNDLAAQHNGVNHSVKWHIVCVGLHLIFALIHVILAIMMTFGIERRTQVELGSQTSFWTTFIQVVLQAFAVLYLTFSLFVAQKIFMHRILLSNQTLTKSHDQYASWLGLGGALLTLYKQRAVRAGFRSLAAISLYLASSALVKVTTPALFQLETGSALRNIPTTARSFKSLAYRYPPATDLPSDPRPSSLQDLLMETMLLQKESSLQTSTIGLEGNTLYDIIPVVESANGLVEVDKYVVNVTCFLVLETEGWSREKFFANLFPTSPIALPMDNSVLTAQEAVNGTSLRFDSLFLPLLSWLNITDSHGNYGQSIPLNDTFFGQNTRLGANVMDGLVWGFSKNTGMKTCDRLYGYAYPWGQHQNGWFSRLYGVQPVICSASTYSERGKVDSKQRILVQNPPRKNSSTWIGLPLTPDRKPMIESQAYTTAFDTTGGSPDQSQASVVYLFDCLNGEGRQSQGSAFQRFPSIFEKAIKQSLEIFGRNMTQRNESQSTFRSFPEIKLHDLGNALEDFIALYMFTHQQAIETYNQSLVNEVPVQVPVDTPVSILTLRPLPVFLGLSASSVMLFIAIWIVTTTPIYHSDLDGLGVLQLLWLAHADLEPVTQPTEKKLRIAGAMNSVRLLDGVDTQKKGTTPSYSSSPSEVIEAPESQKAA